MQMFSVALSSTSSPFRAEAVNGSALTKNPVLDQNYFSNSSIYTSDMVQSVTSTEHGRVPTPKKFPNIYKPTSLVHLVKVSFLISDSFNATATNYITSPSPLSKNIKVNFLQIFRARQDAMKIYNRL